MEHNTGRMLREWRQARNWSAATLARELPEPLVDGQMIYRYEKSTEWFGSEANGLWLAERGAFPRECVRTGTSAGHRPTSGEAA